jgi:sodium/hydrogen antiporter
MNDEEKESTYRAFHESVNMSPRALESWLATDESKAAGWKHDGGESVGHASGRHIVDIKRTRKDELTDDQYAHMRKVVGYVHRHLAQPPEGDPTDTRWRHSLMNWGHDPQKSR